MKIKVKVTKLAGETGLMPVGSEMIIDKEKAKSLEAKGIVSIPKPKPKPKKKTVKK